MRRHRRSGCFGPPCKEPRKAVGGRNAGQACRGYGSSPADGSSILPRSTIFEGRRYVEKGTYGKAQVAACGSRRARGGLPLPYRTPSEHDQRPRSNALVEQAGAGSEQPRHEGAFGRIRRHSGLEQARRVCHALTGSFRKRNVRFGFGLLGVPPQIPSPPDRKRCRRVPAALSAGGRDATGGSSRRKV